MKFNFPIRSNIRASWQLFKEHPWFYVGVAAITMFLNFVGHRHSAIISIIITIALLIWTYVGRSIALAAVDGKTEVLNFKSIQSHFPNIKDLLYMVVIGIVVGIITIIGLVALIIPGLYFMIRLSFAQYSYLDRKGGIVASVKDSWHLVQGGTFWTVFLTGIVSVGIAICGIVLLGVGLLVAYPIIMILIARLYRALTLHRKGTPKEAIVEPVVVA